MTRIWSATSGSEHAPLVVLIHGTMDRSTGMLRLSRQLDNACQVLRYDRRGYGRSISECEGQQGPFDMAAQVGDLIELLNERAAIVVGHSYGGNVALALASRVPRLVRAVAVYETPLSWQPWWPGITAGAMAVANTHDPAAAAETFMRRLVGDAVWEALPERTRQTRCAEGPAMLGELSDLRRNQPWQATDVQCPVVVGYGGHGRAHHQRGMQYLHSELPGSRLQILEGCGHDAPLSHPALFAERMVQPLLNDLGY